MPRIRQCADKYAMSDLSAHIVGRMRSAGMNQQKLGAALGLSQQSVSRLLNNPEDMSIGMLRKICKIIDVEEAVVCKAAWCQKTSIK